MKAIRPYTITTPKTGNARKFPLRNRGVTHGIFITDWNGDRRDDVLTAGFLGLHSHQWNKAWKRIEISKGATDPWPKGGSSDVVVGMLGKKRFSPPSSHGTKHCIGLRREAAGSDRYSARRWSDDRDADLDGDARTRSSRVVVGVPGSRYLQV